MKEFGPVNEVSKIAATTLSRHFFFACAPARSCTLCVAISMDGGMLPRVFRQYLSLFYAFPVTIKLREILKEIVPTSTGETCGEMSCEVTRSN